MKTTSSDAKQHHYVDQLARAGWRMSGGLANAFAFRKAQQCLVVSAWPIEEPQSMAIGADRDLDQPRPADFDVFFLFMRAEPAECERIG
ncbi:MAG: hypothetical protein M3M95_03460 [Pseudomonadota bacterium]|nr:hypothetical protein [Pseudomonadota bacterium]